MVHLSSLFVAGIPVNIAGHAIISVFGNSWRIRYVARFMCSSVVMITMRSSPAFETIFLIACAFWYVDFDSDSISARRFKSPAAGAPAPIMYRSVSGYFCIWRTANGILRSSPVKTNILSSGKITPQLVGADTLNIMPPSKNSAKNKKDGVKNRISLLLINLMLCDV